MESCWQNKDRAVVGSSIVLLQERFKQLQRLKETRKEKQLLQLMMLPREDDDDHGSAKSTSTNLSPSYASSNYHDDPLALGLNTNASYEKHIVSRVKTIRDSQYRLVPSNRTNKGSPGFAAKHDVDTSLRL